MRIIGVSFDTPEANQAFATKQNWDFELWSDKSKTLALYYGVISNESNKRPKRMTKILNAQGELVLEYPKVSPAVHAQQVLEDCQDLFGP